MLKGDLVNDARYLTVCRRKIAPQLFKKIFTARRLAKRGICHRCVSVCLSVCLCVCPSHSGIVSKRLNVGSRK